MGLDFRVRDWPVRAVASGTNLEGWCAQAVAKDLGGRNRPSAGAGAGAVRRAAPKASSCRRPPRAAVGRVAQRPHPAAAMQQSPSSGWSQGASAGPTSSWACRGWAVCCAQAAADVRSCPPAESVADRAMRAAANRTSQRRRGAVTSACPPCPWPDPTDLPRAAMPIMKASIAPVAAGTLSLGKFAPVSSPRTAGRRAGSSGPPSAIAENPAPGRFGVSAFGCDVLSLYP